MAAQVLVVVGARGGCGASTVAGLLARERARSGSRGPGARSGNRHRVARLDLDQGRGGVEVLLGIEARPGARWADLSQVHGGLAAADLDGVLPRWAGVEVLGADRRVGVPSADAVAAVLAALVEGCSTVVVDLPGHRLVARELPADPGRGDVAQTVLAARTDLLLVTGQDVMGVAGALAVRDVLGPGAAGLVLRARRRARVAPLEAARVLDLPLLATVPTDRRLAEATDRGLGPVVAPWSRLGRAVGRLSRAAGDG